MYFNTKKMIWIIVAIGLVIFFFLYSLDKDSRELEKQKIDDKFNTIIKILNKNIFDSQAQVYVIDKRSFNLHQEGVNKIIQFMYSTGGLNIIYRSNFLGEEVTCQRLFDNIRNASKDQQKKIAETFTKQILMKMKVLEKIKNSNLLNEKWNLIEETKYNINSMFYAFCFSKETAKNFLTHSDIQENIAKGLILTIFEREKLLEKIFKIFLKKIYNFSLGESSYNFYRINDYKVFIDVTRVQFKEEESYFEILYNDIKDVRNKDNEEMTVANEFILYCVHNRPKAIFVLVYEPILEKFAIRRVLEDGVSIRLAFIADNEGTEAIDYIKDYISKNNFF